MSVIPAFGPWTEQDHQGKKQESAISKAQLSKTTPISVDSTAQTAIFWGSGKEPYQTSLSVCTCSEFVRFKVPCKHIYRLAMELGIVNFSYDTGMSSGERAAMQISFEDAVGIIEALSPEAQHEIYNMLSIQIDSRHTPHLITDQEIIAEFRACPLLEEHPATALMLSMMKRKSLNDLISISGVSNAPKKNSASTVLVQWLLENMPNLSDFLPPYAAFSLIPNFDKAQVAMIKHFNRIYGIC